MKRINSTWWMGNVSDTGQSYEFYSLTQNLRQQLGVLVNFPCIGSVQLSSMKHTHSVKKTLMTNVTIQWQQMGLVIRRKLSCTNGRLTLALRLMSLEFKLRDIFRPRKDILREVGINTGFKILDYGCGLGAYISVIEELTGKTSKIYV